MVQIDQLLVQLAHSCKVSIQYISRLVYNKTVIKGIFSLHIYTNGWLLQSARIISSKVSNYS